jgi:tRNA-specific 2-thiouridylase
VKELARGYKLPVFERDESQEICFIKSKRYGDFLNKHLKLISGDIVNLVGDKIGRHQGLPLYTIGQRREIGIGGTGPYYVVGTDFKNNKLIVSNNSDDPALYSKELIAEKVNWIAGEKPKLPLKIKAKVRYRSKEATATVNQENKDKFKVIFKNSQRAIMPGQSVVFYLKDEVLGGGVID